MSQWAKATVVGGGGGQAEAAVRRQWSATARRDDDDAQCDCRRGDAVAVAVAVAASNGVTPTPPGTRCSPVDVNSWIRLCMTVTARRVPGARLTRKSRGMFLGSFEFYKWAPLRAA